MKKFLSLMIINKVYDKLPEISILERVFFHLAFVVGVFLWPLQQELLSTFVPCERYATD